MNTDNKGAVKNRITDEDLTDVTGGFMETTPGLGTTNKEIVCPVCNESKADGFLTEVTVDPKTGSVEYTCKCGCAFICYDDNVILKADWIKECAKNNYIYK